PLQPGSHRMPRSHLPALYGLVVTPSAGHARHVATSGLVNTIAIIVFIMATYEAYDEGSTRRRRSGGTGPIGLSRPRPRDEAGSPRTVAAHPAPPRRRHAGGDPGRPGRAAGGRGR